MRAVGIKVFAALVSLLIGQPISDPTCGLRCFNREAMRYLARYHPQDYPEVESMVVLHRAGFRLKELPVEIYPRIGGVSSISTGKAIYYVFRVMLAASIAAVRSVPERRRVSKRTHCHRNGVGQTGPTRPVAAGGPRSTWEEEEPYVT
jgi:hypothetical protein